MTDITQATKQFEARSVRYHRDHDGTPIPSATLYVDGVKTALFDEDDWGAPARWDVLDEKRMAEFDAFAAAMAHDCSYGIDMPMDRNLLIEHLIHYQRQRKSVITRLKKNVLFIKADAQSGEYYSTSIGASTPEQAVAHVTGKYPGATCISRRNTAAEIDAFVLRLTEN